MLFFRCQISALRCWNKVFISFLYSYYVTLHMRLWFPLTISFANILLLKEKVMVLSSSLVISPRSERPPSAAPWRAIIEDRQPSMWWCHTPEPDTIVPLAVRQQQFLVYRAQQLVFINGIGCVNCSLWKTQIFLSYCGGWLNVPSFPSFLL